ncbi:LOW QUALITY PROTEIN: ornithine decarboxylase antizyme 3 [Perognathus longimembris pacificus]|uniref:LOW QUALITY PROTEIN: ornithine decarboxylase antizyme 3 n=1 Tax=Perognathus longimembris pacificus TaxID=214514 RepID=UPI002018A161|nr:LOW QUALITY PROTEIN: ornithine decarboxylase antizyme 3 [Perognathus longimembris pacificus]
MMPDTEGDPKDPGAGGGKGPAGAVREKLPCYRSRPSLYSLSYIKRGKTRNYLYPIWSPYAYYLYCYKYRITLREKMLPCCYRSITYKEQEDLTLRPRCCLQCSESLGGLQVGKSTEQEKDHNQLKELYSAGNLTVLSTDILLHQDPVQLDFHFRLTPHSCAHWHGLLSDHRLFLDIPFRALDQGNRESLTATLEYVEEKTSVDSVFVNFPNNRKDRGALLRAFSYMGFEVVRPDHPALPPWGNVIFMVYPLERDLVNLPTEPP